MEIFYIALAASILGIFALIPSLYIAKAWPYTLVVTVIITSLTVLVLASNSTKDTLARQLDEKTTAVLTDRAEAVLKASEIYFEENGEFTTVAGLIVADPALGDLVSTADTEITQTPGTDLIAVESVYTTSLGDGVRDFESVATVTFNVDGNSNADGIENLEFSAEIEK